ncbi:hypothetical protein Metvu_0287 [Methanocaldococcus vulcanius M7]|uniref:Uncharacterized protein n=1 Tax=Methanocaldococcus vulcanius (strain ATCC 700851 / DSM 12094 / M7) TaxID=579137 RepID=C9RF02_METVM|nr:hypothetical protein Metvu_0287 [Methanocaldococcus vulcanius M7]
MMKHRSIMINAILLSFWLILAYLLPNSLQFLNYLGVEDVNYVGAFMLILLTILSIISLILLTRSMKKCLINKN